MASSTTNVGPRNDNGRKYRFSPLPQSDSDDLVQNDQPLSISIDSTGPSTSTTNVESQNENAHEHKFFPLPQSDSYDQVQNHRPLSISIESTGPSIDIHSKEILRISTRTHELIQDLLSLILILMLLLLPLYKHLGQRPSNPVPPVFALDSMYVYNFTTAAGELASAWDAKITVTNTNLSSIYFRSIDYTLFYKQNLEQALSFASSNPFYMERGQSVKLHLKFRTTGLVEEWLVADIEKDMAEDGDLSFGMKMKAEAVYYGETWISYVEMNPHCEGLKFEFVANKTLGRLINPNRNFSVPIGWKPLTLF